MFLGTVLPKDHLSPDARDVIKVAMAMIATLAALVLGLLTASAKSSLDEKESELRSAAAQVVLLDRTMAEYGADTGGARDLLKQTVAARISQIWPEENTNVTPGAIGRGRPQSSIHLWCQARHAISLRLFLLSPLDAGRRRPKPAPA
jgi:hypothetical protein